MVRDVIASLRSEWSENATVRNGVLLIVGILWLYGLLVWYDDRPGPGTSGGYFCRITDGGRMVWPKITWPKRRRK